MPTFVMSLPLLYLQTLGSGGAQFNFSFLLSPFPLIYHHGSTLMVEDLVLGFRGHVGSTNQRLWEGLIFFLIKCYELIQITMLLVYKVEKRPKKRKKKIMICELIVNDYMVWLLSRTCASSSNLQGARILDFGDMLCEALKFQRLQRHTRPL